LTLQALAAHPHLDHPVERGMKTFLNLLLKMYFIPAVNGKHQKNVPVVLAFLRLPELQVSLSNPKRKRMQKTRDVFEQRVIKFCPQLFYY